MPRFGDAGDGSGAGTSGGGLDHSSQNNGSSGYGGGGGDRGDMSRAEEAAAYGLTEAQLEAAERFEQVAKDSGSYMDPVSGKMVDPNKGMAKAGYKQGADFAKTLDSSVTERSTLGGLYDSFRGMGPIAAMLSPGTAIAGLLADRFGLFDAPLGSKPSGQQTGTSGSTDFAGGSGRGGDGAGALGLSMPQQFASGDKPATSVVDPNSATAWFKANPGANDVSIRKAQDANKWSAEDVAKALNTDTAHWGARYNAATPYFNFGSMMDEALSGDLSGFGSFMNQRVPPAKRSA